MVRIKHRYLLLNILYPDPASSKITPDSPGILKFHAPTPQHVNSRLFSAHLRSHISAAFGDQGLGLCLSSLKIVYFSNATSTIILRVPRAHHHIVWAALSYMNELPAPHRRSSSGMRCVIRVVRVSGTIRKIEEDLMRRSRQHIVQMKLAGLSVQDAVLDRLTGGDENGLTHSQNPKLTTEDEAEDSDSE